MKTYRWLQAHPRTPLTVALVVLYVVSWLALSAGYTFQETFTWTVVLYVYPVVLPITVWTLRQRGVSLRWLFLFLVGLGLVVVPIALFAPPRPKAQVPGPQQQV